jgi:hypothetical protein
MSEASRPTEHEAAGRVLRRGALTCGLLSLLLLVALVVMAALGEGTANNDLTSLEANVTWGLIWGSPALIVVALNLLIWRALLRPLAWMATGKRVALVITMVIVLAVLSVGVVAVLLTLGFVVAALFSAGSGFGG